MTKAEHLDYVTRDLILELLSEAEVSAVSTAESAAKLSEGEEYIDLEHLGMGVQRADGLVVVMGRVLPRKAVRGPTWTRVLSQLKAVTPPAPRAGP